MLRASHFLFDSTTIIMLYLDQYLGPNCPFSWIKRKFFFFPES